MPDSNLVLSVLVKVFKLVGLTELYYAGSHGMDIIFPARDMASRDDINYVNATDKEVFCRFFSIILIFSYHLFSRLVIVPYYMCRERRLIYSSLLGNFYL